VGQEAEAPAQPAKGGEVRRPRQDSSVVLLGKAQEAFQVAEEESEKLEERLTLEFIEARQATVEKEEALRGVERALVRQRDNELATIQVHRQEMANIEARIRDLQVALEDGQARRKIQILQDKLKESTKVVDNLEQMAEQREGKRTAEIVRARKELIEAEEHQASVERRQAAQRAKAQARVEAAHQRLRQLEEPEPRAEKGRESGEAAERKLELLLQEIKQLRKEVRHQHEKN
jgi:hypothetical protein